jgi:hypothetical protein
MARLGGIVLRGNAMSTTPDGFIEPTNKDEAQHETSVQSPFIEGTNIQFAWDSVSLSTILECPQRYKLKIIEGWRNKAPGYAIALGFGILVHTGVEEYHRARANKKSHDEATKFALRRVMEKRNAPDEPTLYSLLPTPDAITQLKEETDEDEGDTGGSLRNAKVRTRYHLWRALVWYFEQYRNDPMEVVQLANGTPAVEHSFRVDVGKSLSDGTPILLAGHIDKLVRFNGQVLVTDVKTTKSISRLYFRMFDLSHQMTGYTLGGKLALPEPIAGVCIDAIELQIGGVKFSRGFTYRTESQLNEYRDLLGYVGSMAERYYYEDYYPLNTAACMFCEFKDVCSQPPELRHGYLNFLFERREAWNPLKSR